MVVVVVVVVGEDLVLLMVIFILLSGVRSILWWMRVNCSHEGSESTGHQN